MIQNYQTWALSDTDESKNTYSNKTVRPRFGYPSHPPSSTSENAVEFLPTTAARTRPRPRNQARLPRATHAQRLQLAVHPLLAYFGRHAVCFLYRNVGVGLLVCLRTSTATCGAIGAIRWVRWAGQFVALMLLSDQWTWVGGRWQTFLKVVVGYELEKEYKQSVRYSYSKIAEIKTRERIK